MGEAQGNKVSTPLLRLRRARRQPVSGQIRPSRRPHRCARSHRKRSRNMAIRLRHAGTCMAVHAVTSLTSQRRAPHASPRNPTGVMRPVQSRHRPPSHRTASANASTKAASASGRPQLHPRPAARRLSNRTRREEMEQAALCPKACDEQDQVRGTPRADGSGAEIAFTRTNAVAPTAIAPITEKTNCHVSDGIVYVTMPRVA